MFRSWFSWFSVYPASSRPGFDDTQDYKPGRETHTCNPSIWKRQGNQRFKVTFKYKLRLRPAWATWNPVPKQQQKKRIRNQVGGAQLLRGWGKRLSNTQPAELARNSEMNANRLHNTQPGVPHHCPSYGRCSHPVHGRHALCRKHFWPIAIYSSQGRRQSG